MIINSFVIGIAFTYQWQFKLVTTTSSCRIFFFISSQCSHITNTNPNISWMSAHCLQENTSFCTFMRLICICEVEVATEVKRTLFVEIPINSNQCQIRKCITVFSSDTGCAGIVGYAYKSMPAELFGGYEYNTKHSFFGSILSHLLCWIVWDGHSIGSSTD